MARGNVPDSVWLDPKTGKEPKTPKEFEAQNERVARWLEKRAIEAVKAAAEQAKREGK